MRNAGLDEARAAIKIPRRNINNLRYADDPILMAESREELKSLLMKVKEETERVDLKLNIQKTMIMAPDPITSWQIDGEPVETVSDFILGGSKITADGYCSHVIKRRLLLGKKSHDQPKKYIKKQRCYLANKFPSSQIMDFPEIMYGCESWTIKKAKHRRIDGFEVWCWRSLSLFFLLLLYFTLQYCIGFVIHQHKSTTGVHGEDS